MLHREAFKDARDQLLSCHPDASRWFADCVSSFDRALQAVRVSTEACVASTGPLWIAGARPRHLMGKRRQPLVAYVSFEATVLAHGVRRSSVKLGLMNNARSEVRFRVQFDFDCDADSRSNSFPFHIHFGKPAGELHGHVPAVRMRYDGKIDEPRLPSPPLDCLNILQLVHEQLNGPEVTESIQCAQWSDHLNKMAANSLVLWAEELRTRAPARDAGSLLQVVRQTRIPW